MTTEIKEHRFQKISDLLALSDTEFERMIPDLWMWHRLGTAMQEHPKEFDLLDSVFIWVDDGKPTEIHSIELANRKTGEKITVKGSAFEGGSL